MIKNCDWFVLLKNRSPGFLQTCLAHKMAIDFKSRDWRGLERTYLANVNKCDHCLRNANQILKSKHVYKMQLQKKV